MRQYGRKRVHTVECKGIGHQHLTETSTKSGRARARRDGHRMALGPDDDAEFSRQASAWSEPRGDYGANYCEACERGLCDAAFPVADACAALGESLGLGTSVDAALILDALGIPKVYS
jgi:hypothetical protein